jgi:hypothetical protein
MFHASTAAPQPIDAGPIETGHHNTYLTLPSQPTNNPLEPLIRAVPMVLMFITGVSIGAVALQRITSLEEWKNRFEEERFTQDHAAALRAEMLAEMRIVRMEAAQDYERLRAFGDESRRRISVLEDAAFGRNTEGALEP